MIVFVEDPGAAVFVAGLPAAAADASPCAVRLLAVQPAADFLRARGVAFEEVAADTAARDVMREKPSVLVVGTSENVCSPAFDMVSAARAAGVPSVGVVDSVANASCRFRGETSDPLAHAPDWLLVPDDATRAAYIALGYAVGRIVVCGHPQHEVVMDLAHRLSAEGRDVVRQRVLPVAAGRRIVMFAAEVSTGLNPEQYLRSDDYTLYGSRGSRDRTSIVLDEFLLAVNGLPERPYLVLRLHPKNKQSDFTRYLDAFDLVSAGGSPLEAAFAADVVVGMTSMLLMEAALMGVATLSIVPRVTETDWLPAIAAGLIPCATRRAAVTSLLHAGLARGPAPPAPRSAGGHAVIIAFLMELRRTPNIDTKAVGAVTRTRQ